MTAESPGGGRSVTVRDRVAGAGRTVAAKPVANPFIIPGPALVSFSGGRTSGLMLWRMLEAYGGTLPLDTYVVFANTGKEKPETLNFVREVSERWDCPIHWIEYAGKGVYREVTYATASRDGEPFDVLIAEKKYLPNTVTRFCTEVLKVKGFAWFMAARGHGDMGDWPNIVGMRADEPRRVAKMARRNDEGGEWNLTPLATAGATKADVLAFWAAQPFGLNLLPWQGNCDLCFLKGEKIRVRILRDEPRVGDWWAAREVQIGATFDKKATIPQLGFLSRLPMLPGMDDEITDDDSAAIPCMCSD